MKEDDVEQFLNRHKESLSGEAFNTRLFNTLDCLPQPAPQKNNRSLIVGVFACIGFLLFVFFGGYGVLLKGFSSIGEVFVDVRSITPEMTTACIMLTFVFVALARFATRSYNR